MSETLLFAGTSADQVFLPRLKGIVGSASVYVRLEPITTLTEITLYCKKRNITGVISTSHSLLLRLLGVEKASLNDYAGSYFFRDGIEFVFINPLEQFVTVPYYKFLTQRYVSKLTDPASWPAAPEFNFDILTPANIEEHYEKFHQAYAIAVDIETKKEPLAITHIGYCAIYLSDGGSISTHAVVLKVDSEWALAWMRKFNNLPAQKIFQNGKYDCSYLSSWNAVPYNYLWDTATQFHCWYSEMPKDLAALGAFFIRKVQYWKDLAETNDPYEYARYNALDIWTTACVWIQWMLQAPEWARTNYLQEFPLIFPCHLSEMTGLKRDFGKLEEARKEIKGNIDEKLGSLRRMIGVPTFNPGSPKQVKTLLTVLGCGDLDSSDEKNLKKACLRHPLNSRILNTILDLRGDRKLISTYLRTDEDKEKEKDKGNKEYRGRILYALNPHGTDSGRLASREHHFWCGLQIQNIPAGKAVKQTIVADDGFLLAEVDLEQAESRDTGYISGDENVINAVENSPDFHSANASMFFGVPFDQIYDTKLGKVINKPLRTLAKPVNHGANYNMGPGVLIDSMGEDKVLEAKKLLNLPKLWSLKQVAEYLLTQFHKAFPKIKPVFHEGVKAEVMKFRMLISRAKHHCEYQATEVGWVRYCFGDPEKNKLHLNSYISHPPQSLNAMTLNKAYMRVFYDIAMHPEHKKNFKLCAQIHDSVLCQVRAGHEYLITMVKERMEIPVTVQGYDGITRTFTVPAAIKAGKEGKGVKYWSDTD